MYDWTVTNKYYSATLRLTLVPGDTAEPTPAVEAVFDGCEALFLVLDASTVRYRRAKLRASMHHRRD